MQNAIRRKYAGLILFAVTFFFLAISCDHGIEPLEAETSGFSGTITFISDWCSMFCMCRIMCGIGVGGCGWKVCCQWALKASATSVGSVMRVLLWLR